MHGWHRFAFYKSPLIKVPHCSEDVLSENVKTTLSGGVVAPTPQMCTATRLGLLVAEHEKMQRQSNL
jgi:hypothetical protein